MKKTTKTLIISIVAVVLLVGIFLLVYFLLPQQEDPKDTANNSLEPTTEEFTETYNLVSHVPADIKQIDVENETGKYTLRSETPTTQVTDSDGNTSEATEATVYTLVGYEDLELLGGTPDTLANDAASVESSKIVNDGSKKSDFGFDSPRAKVTTTFTNGDKATVTVGSDAPDNQGAYIMVEGDSNIYLVESDAVDGYLLGAMGMISTEIGSAATDEAGNVFSKMVFGGELFGTDVTFEYANSEAYSETYKITSPDNVLANEEVVTYMINNVRNLTAKSVAVVNADKNQIKEYGIDKPYVTVEAEYPDLKVSYKASKPDGEGRFYLLSNGIIYEMSTDSVPWVLHDYNECVIKTIIRPKYNSVDKIKITAEGNMVYEFDIDTVTESSDDTDVTTTTVKCGGKTLDEDKFNIFYQNLVSAERSGGIEKAGEGKNPKLRVEFMFTDGSSSTAEYFEGENRKCPVVINGTLWSTAYESYVTKILEDLPIVANNGDVKSIY